MQDKEQKSIGEAQDCLSVVIAISDRFDDIGTVYEAYREALSERDYRYHFFYVLDGEHPAAARALESLIANGEPVSVIKLGRWFGEATALSAGFSASSADRILTLPPYLQIEPAEIHRIIEALDDCDVAVGTRVRDKDTRFNKAQSRLFNWTVRKLTGASFTDLGCGARALRRQVADEIQLYGDQHRFLTLLASRQGFRVNEVACRQHPTDQQSRVYGAGIYVRRLLDVLTAFFLVKFTKKPLRFFGLVGSTLFASGVIMLVVLAFQRLWFDIPAGDRPLLLVATLLVTLGIQIIAIGLIGEIIIFTHARELKEYNIDRIVTGGENAPSDEPTA